MKILVVLVVLAGAGWFAWTHFAKPERGACAKMASLCGDSFKADECARMLDDTRKQGGDEAITKFAACTSNAKTCPEAAGCLVGAGLQGLAKSAGEFFKGISGTLGK